MTVYDGRVCCCGGSTDILGNGAGVEVVVTIEVGAEPVVSPLALALLDAFEALEEVLAFPGDVAGGVRSTKALISTLAADAGSTARSCRYWACPPRNHALIDGFVPIRMYSRVVVIEPMTDRSIDSLVVDQSVIEL